MSHTHEARHAVLRMHDARCPLTFPPQAPVIFSADTPPNTVMLLTYWDCSVQAICDAVCQPPFHVSQ